VSTDLNNNKRRRDGNKMPAKVKREGESSYLYLGLILLYNRHNCNAKSVVFVAG